jgi:hypothetical protein
MMYTSELDRHDFDFSSAELRAHLAVWRVELVAVPVGGNYHGSPREVLYEAQEFGGYEAALSEWDALGCTLRDRMRALVDERGDAAPTLSLELNKYMADGRDLIDYVEQETYSPADLANDEAADASAA